LKSHKDLDVWKRSIALVTEIYRITKTFPDDEKYGMIHQMRRSAVSVPSNIAEGSARHTKKDNIQFLYVALGSISELETQLIISLHLGYISEELLESFQKEILEIKNMTIGLIRYLSRQQKPVH
jgi:four helix bundle protein